MHNAGMGTAVAGHASDRRRRLVLGLMLGLAALAMVLSGAARANAHAELESTSPANGAQLDAAPKQVKLVFGEDILPQGTQLVAFSSDKTPVALANENVSGPNLTADWPASAPSGSYTVSYRVTSADGHPIDGTLKFSYGSAGASASSSSNPGGAAASASTGGEPSTAQSAQPASASSDGRSTWWIIAAIVIIGVLLGGLLAKVLANRRGGGGQ